MKSLKYTMFLLTIALFTMLFINACDNRTMKPETYYITNMTANPNVIYADNGITYSEIAVTVKNEDNFAVTGEEVRFRTSLGNILFKVNTDSTGVAHSTFWDNGTTGTAIIEAFIGSVNASTEVIIEDAPPIDNIGIDAPDNMVVGNMNQIKAYVTNTLGPVPNNTIVVFDTDLGDFRDAEGTDLGSTTQVLTSNGIAKVNFDCGTSTGTATISVTVSNVQEQVVIPIKPGSPHNMDLTANPNWLQVNSGETSTVTAIVRDNFSNRVGAGVGVDFTASLGNITAFSTTDSMGTALAFYSPGVQAGIAQIEAVADSASAVTTITVASDGVYSLEFAFSGKIDIQLQGTGGNESAEIVVNLYDSNGNLIDEDIGVWFQFITGPAGANINNQISTTTGDSLMVESSNGQAVVSVNSGTQPGTIAMKASHVSDMGNYFSAVKSNIVVHSGPPNTIELSIGDFDSGVNMGGGVWQIECAAIITDEWGNPVDYGTAVWFSLGDAEEPDENPSWATIGAEAYVGNESTSGDSLSGVAFTYLNYEGAHTNDSLWVFVEVSAPQGILMDSTMVIMPIQFASIDLLAVPNHLDWTATNNPAYQYTTVVALITDGQNNPINGQAVYFTSNPGTPVAGPTSTTADYLGITGNINGQDGLIHKSVLFYKWECPEPGIQPPGTTEAIVVGTILGTGVSGDTSVTLNRWVP